MHLISRVKKKESVVDFYAALTKARSMLIFMPENNDHFGAAKVLLKKIKTQLPGKTVVICTNHKEINLDRNSQVDGIIFVTPDDVNFLGLPRKKLTQKIQATDFDMILDLNVDFQPVSSYLSQKSNAPIKVCLYNHHKEPFYNLAFRTDQEAATEVKYDRLIDFLGSCVHQS